MKSTFFILIFLISCTSFAQNNYIVKTEDGRRVLLKADYTWEYIDLVAPTEKKSDSISVSTPAVGKTNSCELAADFKEPELNNKIQSQLKKGRATIKHVKNKVAKDESCAVEDVILLSVKEQKTQAVYLFCANGKKVSYKRHGNSIMKSGKLF
jgi:hypothetical protein